jgi:hypothetical protein
MSDQERNTAIHTERALRTVPAAPYGQPGNQNF